jgi:cystathionine gamma-synthase/methionine-gamma-lyase
MAAINLAITAALPDRRRLILAASALYGATINMLMKVLEPSGIETVFVDFNDEEALAAAIAEHKPGALLLMETISNPLLRVAPLDRIAAMAKDAGAHLIVDSTFATPIVVRPMELGATFVVHSPTKYLSGHGDVLGGVVTTDSANIDAVRTLARSLGPVLGPFESLPRHARDQDLSAAHGAPLSQCLQGRELPRDAPGDRARILSGGPRASGCRDCQTAFRAGSLRRDRDRERRSQGRRPGPVFRLMNAFRLIVPATSLGDAQTMELYPAMASHRELSPKHRARLGINDNLLRLPIGIEAVEDIISDRGRALS